MSKKLENGQKNLRPRIKTKQKLKN